MEWHLVNRDTVMIKKHLNRDRIMKKRKQNRPRLNPIPLTSLSLGGKSGLMITISKNQWDSFIQTVYERGGVLVELDHRDRPIRAFRKQSIQ